MAKRQLSWEERGKINYLVALKNDRKPAKGYATTTREVTLRSWNHKHPAEDDANWTERKVPAGTTLKIVMISRSFEHFGLTDDLQAENGYDLRVDFDDDCLKDIRLEP